MLVNRNAAKDNYTKKYYDYYYDLISADTQHNIIHIQM